MVNRRQSGAPCFVIGLWNPLQTWLSGTRRWKSVLRLKGLAAPHRLDIPDVKDSCNVRANQAAHNTGHSPSPAVRSSPPRQQRLGCMFSEYVCEVTFEHF